jgi:hypothetical protein
MKSLLHIGVNVNTPFLTTPLNQYFYLESTWGLGFSPSSVKIGRKNTGSVLYYDIWVKSEAYADLSRSCLQSYNYLNSPNITYYSNTYTSNGGVDDPITVGGYDAQIPLFGIPSSNIAYALWDFAVDGGTQKTYVLALSSSIPSGAIIVGGQIHVITAANAGANGKISFGTSAGSSTTSLLAATGFATLTLDYIKTIVPTFAAALRLTAAGLINCTITTANFTAGKIEIWVQYYIPGS